MSTEILPKTKTIIKHLSWENFDVAVKELVKQIGNEEFSEIFPIPRGGIVLAGCLSYKLNSSILSQGYLREFTDTSKILFIDDTVDSGQTLDYYKSWFRKAKFATIFYNKQSIVKPDFWVWEQKPEEWIVFPWENTISIN